MRVQNVDEIDPRKIYIMYTCIIILYSYYNNALDRKSEECRITPTGGQGVGQEISLWCSGCWSGRWWLCYRAGVGNYFRPRATSLLQQCLTGHISVKKAKLKKLAFAGRMWPAGRMLPPPAIGDALSQETWQTGSVVSSIPSKKCREEVSALPPVGFSPPPI